MNFYIYTLGCKVNTYESSVIASLMKKSGYNEVAKDDDAQIYIINTCTVTNTAGNKSLKMIRQAHRKNNNAIIVVVGCLSQVESKMVSELPGVSIVLGNKNKSKVVNYIREFMETKKQIIDVYDLDKVERALNKIGKDLTYRAEQLSLEDFVSVFNEIC